MWSLYMSNIEYIEKKIAEAEEKIGQASLDIVHNNLHNKIIAFDDDSINEYISDEYDRADKWEILKENFAFSELDDIAKKQGIQGAVFECFYENLRSEIDLDDIKGISGLYALSWQDDFFVELLSQEQIDQVEELCQSCSDYVKDSDDLTADVLADLIEEKNLVDYVGKCESRNELLQQFNAISGSELSAEDVRAKSLADLQKIVTDKLQEVLEHDEVADLYDVMKEVYDANHTHEEKQTKSNSKTI